MANVSTTTAPISAPAQPARTDHLAGSCLTVDSVLFLRSLEYTSPNVVAAIIPHLAHPCLTCWQAIDDGRAIAVADSLPATDVPEIRLLRTLTVAAEEALMPFHRLARDQARDMPLGVFRLMLEEIRRDLAVAPQLAISHLRHLREALGDDPPETCHREWNDLVICLTATEARAWAECGCHRQADLLLLGAHKHFAYEEHDEVLPGYHLDQARCFFLRGYTEGEWQKAVHASRQGLLADDERQREILLEYARWNAADGELEEAHGQALEVVLGGEGKQDVLLLEALHLLTQIEIRLSVEQFLEPAQSGLYFQMAMAHFEEAVPLYAEWGQGAMLREFAEHCRFIERESERWATPAGLQKRWQEHHASGRRESSLYEWTLLAMAACINDDALIEEALPRLKRSYQEDPSFREEIGEFQEFARSLQNLFPEAQREELFAPWYRMLDEVRS